jgi:hypothetical protein
MLAGGQRAGIDGRTAANHQPEQNAQADPAAIAFPVTSKHASFLGQGCMPHREPWQ